MISYHSRGLKLFAMVQASVTRITIEPGFHHQVQDRFTDNDRVLTRHRFLGHTRAEQQANALLLTHLRKPVDEKMNSSNGRRHPLANRNSETQSLKWSKIEMSFRNHLPRRGRRKNFSAESFAEETLRLAFHTAFSIALPVAGSRE